MMDAFALLLGLFGTTNQRAVGLETDAFALLLGLFGTRFFSYINL